MRIFHFPSYLRYNRHDYKRSHGMTDERRDNEDHGSENDEDGEEAHSRDTLANFLGDGREEARRGDGFTERNAAHGQHYDCPEEIVEIFFGEDSGAEEDDEGDDCDDTHVAEEGFELVLDAP